MASDGSLEGIVQKGAYPPPARSESRLPPLLTVLAAIGLQLLLPARLTIGPRWALAVLEGLMLIGLLVVSPQSQVPIEHLPSRRISQAIAALVSLANAVSLGLLIHYLLHNDVANGEQLIVAGAIIWLTNVLIFSLWFWELDRDGPSVRAAGHDGPPDFLFPQMSDDRWYPGWRPMFIDYLYVSLTNSTAFSPTDTMPLSVSAKGIMALQSVVSLVTVGLVVARAVNILG